MNPHRAFRHRPLHPHKQFDIDHRIQTFGDPQVIGNRSVNAYAPKLRSPAVDPVSFRQFATTRHSSARIGNGFAAQTHLSLGRALISSQTQKPTQYSTVLLKFKSAMARGLCFGKTDGSMCERRVRSHRSCGSRWMLKLLIAGSCLMGLLNYAWVRDIRGALTTQGLIQYIKLWDGVAMVECNMQ